MANEISIVRGDTSAITITVTDSNGTAYNLTGFEMWCTVKRNKDDPDISAILQKQCTIDAPLTGVGVLALTAANTDITPGRYYYDIEIFNGDNSVVKTPIVSTFTILQDITAKDGGA